MDALLPANVGERRTLADIIFAKLDDAEAGKKIVIKAGRGSSFSQYPFHFF
jgi:essential nuclear protein 1